MQKQHVFERKKNDKLILLGGENLSYVLRL